MTDLELERIRRIVRNTTAAQGVPRYVTDPVVLAKLAVLFDVPAPRPRRNRPAPKRREAS